MNDKDQLTVRRILARMAKELAAAKADDQNGAIDGGIETMEAKEERLSPGRMKSGLISAAVVGLIAYIAILLSSQTLIFALTEFAFGVKPPNLALVSRAVLYLIFGLPIALTLSLAVGYSVWKRAEARRLRSRRDALVMGAKTGAVIGLLLLAFNGLVALFFYFVEPSLYSGGASKDGMRTLLEWLVEFHNLICFAAAGAIAGLVARCAAFPAGWKRRVNQQTS